MSTTSTPNGGLMSDPVVVQHRPATNPNFARLLDELGIRYGVLADGPAFRAGSAFDDMPHPTAPSADPSHETFDNATVRWSGCGMRTLADDFHDDGSKKGEIEAYFEQLGKQAWSAVRGKGKIRRGAAFASQVPQHPEVLDLWKRFLAHMQITRES